jgi:hypothetical protein
MVKRFSREKRAGNPKPSWFNALSIEMSGLVEQYKDEHVHARSTSAMDSVMALHGHGSFRKWAGKLESGMGEEYDIAMTDKACIWKLAHGNKPLESSKDPVERALGAWLAKKAAEKKAMERQGVL